jgi:antitoxin component of RelBE/YafQ-DinJ toxin-antitoxin module
MRMRRLSFRGKTMAKTDRIQVRVDEERKKWLNDYTKKKNITISRVFRDFIDWLRSREREPDG